MKKSLFIYTMFAFTVGMGFLTACGNTNNNSSGVNSTLPTCVGGNCFYNYGTAAQYATNTTVGFRSQTQSGYTNNVGYGYQQQAGAMQVQSSFVNILRDAMGVCDRNTYSGGMSACSSWLGGQHSVSFGMNSTSSTGVQLTIKSNYVMNPNYNYYYSLPSVQNMALNFLGIPTAQNPQGTYNPLILNGNIWPVNNSQGFEIRAYGPTGSFAYNKLFQLQVPTGKVQDGSVQYILFFNGAQAASGSMTNCGSSSCAMGY
jgi:hypothetical protein